MELQIENLKALIKGVELIPYQRALALQEWNNLLGYVKDLEQLNAPLVINNEEEASSEGVAVCCDTCKYVNGFRCKHPQGCETDGGYDFWEQRTDL